MTALFCLIGICLMDYCLNSIRSTILEGDVVHHIKVLYSLTLTGWNKYSILYRFHSECKIALTLDINQKCSNLGFTALTSCVTSGIGIMTLMHGLNRKYTVDCCSEILTCSIVEFILGLYVLYILLQFTPLKKKRNVKKRKKTKGSKSKYLVVY